MGRPSLYTPELADHICELIAEGYPLHRFNERDDVPHQATVCRWLDANPDFCEQYARARTRLADKFAEEVVAIADAADPTTMKGIEHARTRMDARKWASGKLAPKKYGEWKRTEVTGADGGAIETKQHVDLSALPDELLAELAKAIEG